jgi:hypothetical protein
MQDMMTEIDAKIAALEEAGATEQDNVQPVLHLQDETFSTEIREEPNLTERAFDVVNSLPEGKSLRRSAIGRILRSQQEPKGKNFPITLFKTLIRLKDQGRIGGTKTEGIWFFFSKK